MVDYPKFLEVSEYSRFTSILFYEVVCRQNYVDNEFSETT